MPVGSKACRQAPRASFSHGGSNWGFRCTLIAHQRKGYGAVVMTNGDNGGRVAAELVERIAVAYGWSSLDKPLPR